MDQDEAQAAATLSIILTAVGGCLQHDGHTQVGRCVYCSCGRRLYQGVPFTDDELKELRAYIRPEEGP